MDLTIRSFDDKILVKKLVTKKLHFSFGDSNNMGCIRILRRRSNIFMIFEDLNCKTIICHTSGSSGIIGLKRRKREPQAVENIFKMIYPYLKAYNIKFVMIILNTRLNGCYYTLLRELEFYGIIVRKCTIQRRVAFNGCRGRKLRRVQSMLNRNIIRSDIKFADIFPIRAFVKVPVYPRKHNIWHNIPRILGYYRERYLGQKYLRVDYGSKEYLYVQAAHIIPTQYRIRSYSLRYYYWHKFSYLFNRTYNGDKLLTWSLGLSYASRLFNLDCTRFHKLFRFKSRTIYNLFHGKDLFDLAIITRYGIGCKNISLSSEFYSARLWYDLITNNMYSCMLQKSFVYDYLSLNFFSNNNLQIDRLQDNLQKINCFKIKFNILNSTYKFNNNFVRLYMYKLLGYICSNNFYDKNLLEQVIYSNKFYELCRFLLHSGYEDRILLYSKFCDSFETSDPRLQHIVTYFAKVKVCIEQICYHDIYRSEPIDHELLYDEIGILSSSDIEVEYLVYLFSHLEIDLCWVEKFFMFFFSIDIYRVYQIPDLSILFEEVWSIYSRHINLLFIQFCYFEFRSIFEIDNIITKGKLSDISIFNTKFNVNSLGQFYSAILRKWSYPAKNFNSNDKIFGRTFKKYRHNEFRMGQLYTSMRSHGFERSTKYNVSLRYRNYTSLYFHSKSTLLTRLKYYSLRTKKFMMFLSKFTSTIMRTSILKLLSSKKVNNWFSDILLCLYNLMNIFHFDEYNYSSYELVEEGISILTAYSRRFLLDRNYYIICRDEIV